MYDTITSTALERGKELYDKGLTGTEEFRAIADLFSNQDLSTASVAEVVATYESALPITKTFFTEGEERAARFVDDDLETQQAKLEEYTNKAKEAQESLKSLNNESLAPALEFDLDELDTVEELESKITELNQAKANSGINDEQAQQLQTVIDACQLKLDALNSTQATPGVTLDGVQSAYSSAGELISQITKIQNLNASTNLNINISGDHRHPWQYQNSC